MFGRLLDATVGVAGLMVAVRAIGRGHFVTAAALVTASLACLLLVMLRGDDA